MNIFSRSPRRSIIAALVAGALALSGLMAFQATAQTGALATPGTIHVSVKLPPAPKATPAPIGGVFVVVREVATGRDYGGFTDAAGSARVSLDFATGQRSRTFRVYVGSCVGRVAPKRVTLRPGANKVVKITSRKYCPLNAGS